MKTNAVADRRKAAVLGCEGFSWRQGTFAVLFFVSAALARVLLPDDAGVVLRAAAVIVPIIFGIGYVGTLIRDVRRLDELQIRLNFEGAAVAAIGIFLLMAIYPVLERAGIVGKLQPEYVLYGIAGLGAAGYFAAVRRYR